jgi:PEP-CTERM motif
MNTHANVRLIVVACLGIAIWPAAAHAADFYFGNFDDTPTYTITNTGAYNNPNRTGWIDLQLQGQPISANTSTTIGVTSGTQSLAWQPARVGFYYGIGFKVQLSPLPLADRNAIIDAFLANTHLAMNVTWVRNEWVTQHQGDINVQNYSLVNAFAVNFGPNGGFAELGPPSVDTGNPGFPGGYDPVNYTDPTHTRIVMWDYSTVKPLVQALYTSGDLNGQNGWLEFILGTNAASSSDDPVNYYAPPVTYYLDSWRFTTPGAGVPGDYDGNGSVDAADYVVWRKGGTLQNEVADPGIVSVEDYTEWRARFGNTGGAGTINASAVPEPSTLLLVLAAIGLCATRQRVGK